ncbi:23S rRNA methyltransferase [Mycobacterium sp. ITM-2017-0098]|nr:23S rRNA methyltransferase [Mycobacterium sp. ITM-2017-0098]
MTDDGTYEELTLTTGAAANGGSCVARHDGRVVFVRYALPGETVRARLVGDRGSYLNAEVVEVLEASADRIDSLCPIAGVDGAGCCDLAFAQPAAVRRIKGAVVANQLARLGGYQWRDESDAAAEPVGEVGATGWRTRVRLDTSADGRAGFHRYHSAELVHRLDCAQLPAGMLDGVADTQWPAQAAVHVAIDDDGKRHVVVGASGNRGAAGGDRRKSASGSRRGKRSAAGGGIRTAVAEGDYEAVQRVDGRTWHVPVTAFWQAHRDAAALYSSLITQWSHLEPGMTAWDLYGGAGVFAAALARSVGETGAVLTVDTSRGASRSAKAALADLGNVSILTDSVRRALTGQRQRADVAVLDPPRTGAGREVIDLLAAAGVPRIIHIGCEAASFARDVGLYLGHGYAVEELRVFDSFPLTHHVECIAVLQRPVGVA